MLGTLLTLFVVPTVYSYIAKKAPFPAEDAHVPHGVAHPAE
jgi:multidrug efflux pump